MKDFIEFRFDQNNNFYARIHVNGQRKVVRNYENFKQFLLACRDLGYYINEECIITQNVDEILKNYEKRMRKKATLTILGTITENMKLSRKNPAIKKRIGAIALAGVIATTGLGAATVINNHQDATAETSGYYVTYEEPETPKETISIEFGPSIKDESENQIVEDEIQDDTSQQQEENVELASMIDVDVFHYSHADRSDDICITRAHQYDDIFEKYAKQYGLDKNLLAAIAAHESYGNHESGCNVGPAEGLMQIEKSVYLNFTESAYNFETGEMDEVYVTLEKLQDVDTNIQIAAMILQNCMELWDYNIPLAVQTYNLGIGNINKMLSMCSDLEGIDKEDLKYNQENNAWLNYRAFLKTGDPNYVENVFCFLPNNQQITIQKRSGELSSVIVSNDYEMTSQKTN